MNMKDDIKLVCFDLDKTLIRGNSWYDLNMALGITDEEDTCMLAWYEQGIITYRQWVELAIAIAKKRSTVTRQLIQDTFHKPTYSPYAREVVRYVQDQGYAVVLISGSIDILVDKIARELDILHAAANNVFVFDDNDQLAEVVTYGQDDLAKLHHLRGFCETLGIDIAQCVCIGDGDNDRELFLKTGKGITFSDSKIRDIAWKTISNLSEITSLL